MSSRSRRLELAMRIRSRQQVGKIHANLESLAAATDNGQNVVKPGVRAHLGHQFFAVVHLVAGKAGCEEIVNGALNRFESRGQIRLCRIVRVDYRVILKLGSDRKAQAKTVIEPGMQVDAVS